MFTLINSQQNISVYYNLHRYCENYISKLSSYIFITIVSKLQPGNPTQQIFHIFFENMLTYFCNCCFYLTYLKDRKSSIQVSRTRKIYQFSCVSEMQKFNQCSIWLAIFSVDWKAVVNMIKQCEKLSFPEFILKMSQMTMITIQNDLYFPLYL